MRIVYTSTALDHLNALPRDVKKRILDKLHFYVLQESPMRFAERLTGYDVYRFRIGMYRAVVQRRDDMFVVLIVKKRDEAYKKL